MTRYKYDASIIIPTYNRKSLLGLTLKSLKKQKTQFAFEVIVCDDGSNTDNLEVIREYEDTLNIRYYFQKDQGFRASKARNAGIALSEGRVLIFIDDGVVVGEKFVDEHVKSHSQKGMIFCLGYVYGFDDYNKFEKKINILFDIENIKESILGMDREGIVDKREPLYCKLGDKLEKWPAPYVIAWSVNFSVLRENIERIGGFDETYATYGGEDTDFAIKCYVAGFRFILNRKAVSIHYPHEKNKVSVDEQTLEIRTLEKRKYQNLKYRLEGTRVWQESNTFDVNALLLLKRRKVILSDLDGTLNKYVDLIPRISNELEVMKAREENDLFIINTGRNLESFKQAIQKYNLKFFDYAICGNGSLVVDKELNVLFECFLSDSDVKEIINLATKEKFENYSLGRASNNIDISEITFEFENDERAESAFEVFKKNLNEEKMNILANGKYLDISNSEGSKWKSAKRLLEKYFPHSKTVLYSFGDGKNDIDILENSDFSFTFSYSSEVVKKKATFIVNSMLEGLEKIENQLLLSNMNMYE